MPYGRGFGTGRGMGGGFRGSYAAWPYIGRGRGGLPRCGCSFAGPAYARPDYNYDLYSAGNNPELMQAAAANLKDRLAYLKARITDLEQQVKS